MPRPRAEEPRILGFLMLATSQTVTAEPVVAEPVEAQAPAVTMPAEVRDIKVAARTTQEGCREGDVFRYKVHKRRAVLKNFI